MLIAERKNRRSTITLKFRIGVFLNSPRTLAPPSYATGWLGSSATTLPSSCLRSIPSPSTTTSPSSPCASSDRTRRARPGTDPQSTDSPTDSPVGVVVSQHPSQPRAICTPRRTPRGARMLACANPPAVRAARVSKRPRPRAYRCPMDRPDSSHHLKPLRSPIRVA